MLDTKIVIYLLMPFVLYKKFIFQPAILTFFAEIGRDNLL